MLDSGHREALSGKMPDPTAKGNAAGRGRPMRILMVTPRYLPDMGGIETHVHEVSRRLRGHGVVTTVLTTDRSGRLPVGETVEGFSVERVPAYPRNADYYAAPAMWSRIRHGQEDLVHCQGVHTLVPRRRCWPP